MSRLHKDVPFGWVALLRDVLAARAARRQARQGPWGPYVNTPALPGDLHHLAGPH
ncbi:hypothetical protein M9M90_15655 [Phenylobacterium sp. LH3H17]|uniref:hypothetical protein n=1 Tax=Phenylobacterium sp. LH3H17 TaxID=2903901 RepID=UPI0020C9C7BB|nr:hypothetical protein [Phenylobacterium sp. LH3H17]UTP38646.1 hypothetical protein M9M90_15655 [Phenylobacterium sp. LH3H17]